MELKSIFKLSTLFILIAAPASSALADIYGGTPCNFNGFTVGVGLGASTFMNNTILNTNSSSDLFVPLSTQLAVTPTVGNTFSQYANPNLYKYGPMGSLFVGYGAAFANHLYLGAELGINFLWSNKTSVKVSDSNNTTVTSTDVSTGDSGSVNYANLISIHSKTNRSVAEPFLDLKLGFLITPTALVYLRGGTNYNSFDLKTNGTFDAAANSEFFIASGPTTGGDSASTSSSFSSSRKKSLFGYRAGLGMEVMVTPEISVGADYVYSFYQTIRATSSTNTSDVVCDAFEGCQIVNGTIQNSSQAKLSDQQVTMQFIYHLG